MTCVETIILLIIVFILIPTLALNVYCLYQAHLGYKEMIELKERMKKVAR